MTDPLKRRPPPAHPFSFSLPLNRETANHRHERKARSKIVCIMINLGLMMKRSKGLSHAGAMHKFVHYQILSRKSEM
jgi:hypothetical protein